MSSVAGRVLIISKGDYEASATYDVLDMVKHSGVSWLAKKTVTGVEPTDANAEYWHKLYDFDIVNNLATEEEGHALDARQGKILNELITAVNNRITKYGLPHPILLGDFNLNAVSANEFSIVFSPWGAHESKPNEHNFFMVTIPLTGIANHALQIAYDYEGTVVLEAPQIYTRANSPSSISEWVAVGGGNLRSAKAIAGYCSITAGGFTRNSINITVGLRVNVHTEIPAYTNFIESLPSALTGFGALNCMKASGEVISVVYTAGGVIASSAAIPVGEYMISGSYISM